MLPSPAEGEGFNTVRHGTCARRVWRVVCGEPRGFAAWSPPMPPFARCPGTSISISSMVCSPRYGRPAPPATRPATANSSSTSTPNSSSDTSSTPPPTGLSVLPGIAQPDTAPSQSCDHTYARWGGVAGSRSDYGGGGVRFRTRSLLLVLRQRLDLVLVERGGELFVDGAERHRADGQAVSHRTMTERPREHLPPHTIFAHLADN